MCKKVPNLYTLYGLIHVYIVSNGVVEDMVLYGVCMI